MSSRDTVCPVVPLFHACGWSVPYVAAMNGAKLVLPGPRLDGASLYELFEEEGVTMSLGVPTVWLGFEAHLAVTGLRCSTLQRVLSGDRDAALADGPDLDYDDAAELRLLLEQLASAPSNASS